MQVRKDASLAEGVRTNQQMGLAFMSRRTAQLTQGDVARAIRAAKAAGASSLQIKPDGTIVVNLLRPTVEQDANEAVVP